MSEDNKKSYSEHDLRSTSGDFDRFINSKIWFDLRETMKDRIEYLREQLVMLPDSQDSVYEMVAIKNQMKAWTEMMGLPTYLKSLQHKEQSKNSSDEQET